MCMLPDQLLPCAHRNGAVSAAPSMLTELCLENFMDADVDLVFVEFVVNDGSPPTAGMCESPTPKVYERLVRKLLRQPSAPAVVLMQVRACERSLCVVEPLATQ